MNDGGQSWCMRPGSFLRGFGSEMTPIQFSVMFLSLNLHLQLPTATLQIIIIITFQFLADATTTLVFCHRLFIFYINSGWMRCIVKAARVRGTQQLGIIFYDLMFT